MASPVAQGTYAFAATGGDWRRRTGIEPAERGSPVPTVLKTVKPTRYSYAPAMRVPFFHGTHRTSVT